MRTRSTDAAPRRVDLAELTPSLAHVLGQAAYLQLTLFENLAAATAKAPTAESKEVLSRVTAASLAKHHGLTALVTRHGDKPAEVMAPFIAAIDDFQRRTSNPEWAESIMTCYLTAGFLDEFFIDLAAGLPKEYADRVIAVLSEDSRAADLVEELRKQIAAQPVIASRLAMWGRRLVGDTMLVARSALATSADRDKVEERIEPVFSELIAAHTRRMDGLGLTA